MTALQEIGQAENINADMDHLDAEAAMTSGVSTNAPRNRSLRLPEVAPASCVIRSTTRSRSISGPVVPDRTEGRAAVRSDHLFGSLLRSGRYVDRRISDYHVDGRLIEALAVGDE